MFVINRFFKKKTSMNSEPYVKFKIKHTQSMFGLRHNNKLIVIFLKKINNVNTGTY